MLANVLNSPAAVQVSIQVVRAFIRLRQLLATPFYRHLPLSRKSGFLLAILAGLLLMDSSCRPRDSAGLAGRILHVIF